MGVSIIKIMKLGWEETKDDIKGQVTCPLCGGSVCFERKRDEILPDGITMLTCPECVCWWKEALSFQNPGIGGRF